MKGRGRKRHSYQVCSHNRKMANDFHAIEEVARLPVRENGEEVCNLDGTCFDQDNHPLRSRRKMAPAEHQFPVQNIFIPSVPQSQFAQDRKLSPAELASLSWKMGPSSNGISSTSIVSQKISITTVSTTASTDRQDSTVYQSEADFLVENQHQFSDEDFSAVLAALVEESKMDETRKKQERESIKLAQALLSDIEEIPTHTRVSSSDDMAAMVVALRAELEETYMMKKNEEESFRAACILMEEETKMSGFDHSSGSFCEVEADGSSGGVQCQACHFDIERKGSIRELECGHKFHAFCINRYWLTMKKSDCPFCRLIVKQFCYR